MERLYGSFHTDTNYWNDGVMADTVRQCAADPLLRYHWIVLDGPVDSLWIEDMNTVLDDNKKLCLTSGWWETGVFFFFFFFFFFFLLLFCSCTVGGGWSTLPCPLTVSTFHLSTHICLPSVPANPPPLSRPSAPVFRPTRLCRRDHQADAVHDDDV